MKGGEKIASSPLLGAQAALARGHADKQPFALEAPVSEELRLGAPSGAPIVAGRCPPWAGAPIFPLLEPTSLLLVPAQLCCPWSLLIHLRDRATGPTLAVP